MIRKKQKLLYLFAFGSAAFLTPTLAVVRFSFLSELSSVSSVQSS